MIIKTNYYFQKKEKDIYNRRLDKIEKLNNKIDYDNLKYGIYRTKKIYDFSELADPLTLLDEIKKGKISLEQAKNNQKNYLEYLNTIRKGNKNDEQRKTLTNINVHFNARDLKIIEDHLEDYGRLWFNNSCSKKTGKRTTRNRN